MSESEWLKKGATLSHKNACQEFGLTEDEIIKAMKEGRLQYRQNYAHGNPSLILNLGSPINAANCFLYKAFSR
jgi:hypothetical protein